MSIPHLIHSTSISERSEVLENKEIVQTSRRSTFGEMLLDSPFEAVMPISDSSALQFHIRESNRCYNASQVERVGRVYVPPQLNESLARIVRFPSTSEDFGSATRLTGAMADFFCKFGRTSREEAALLTAFALSTWFVDSFRRAPCLHLTGSSTRARLIMRLLACLCRRPLVVGRLDLSALSTLPNGLDPTLLIYEEKLAKSVMRILETSRSREVGIPFGKIWIHAYGARVFFSDPISVKAADLQIHLAPTPGPFPELSDEAEKKIAADFQAQLLRYSLVHFNAVKNWDFECPEINLGMQDDLRALTIPLMGCHLIESVLRSLVYQSHEVAGARFTELDCLVIEAALCFCHDPDQEYFFVKNITDVVNAILERRHEEQVMSSKAVGHALRGLGLFARRVTEGYRVELTTTIRERIHRLAKEYNVASAKQGFDGCEQCDPATAVASEVADVLDE
jgi:hypothetical protein